MSELKMQFDPNTIEHLGIKMYSRLPNALAELIANSYDADADNVHIKLYMNAEKKEIIVEDDGVGMSFEEVNDLFLRIGRRRRETGENRKTPKGRIITGRKGLGKLALFGIGKNIKIQTTKKGSTEKLEFELNWNEITSSDNAIYKPPYSIISTEIDEQGTTFILSDLKRETPFDLQSVASSLSKLFNFMDSNFKIDVSVNNSEPIEITKELRFESIDKQFYWDIQDLSQEITDDYSEKAKLKGKIITPFKPAPSDFRGITVYVNGRLANTAGFFGISESSIVFSYLTGWIEADFIDEYEEDLISTDRQSLNWELEPAEELRDYLIKIVRLVAKKWNEERKSDKEEKASRKTGVNVKAWTDTMPEDLKESIAKIVTDIVDKPEIDEETTSSVVKRLHDIIPEYPLYHFRHIHNNIKDASKEPYTRGDYYEAFIKALKRYKNAVKDKSKVGGDEDYQIMVQSFGSDKVLKVTENFQLRPNGEKFSESTLKNIEDGQKYLSQGIVSEGRNPLSHEEHNDLKETGLFTEKDCLDLLSLLSHLFKRLDDAPDP